MPAAAFTPSGAVRLSRRLTTRGERLRLAALWLAGASGSLVFIEPSPYELATLAAIFVFALSGLAIPAALLPVGALLVLINVGYTISAGGMLDQPKILMWVATSWYLTVTAIFFAAALQDNTQSRLAALMRGCVMAGVIASLAGVAAYFRLVPGAGEFLLYDRARGTFKDPNVFGAFLVLPALLSLQIVVAGRGAQVVKGMALMGLFTIAILLSFSRAAWGMLAFTGILMLGLIFVTTRSGNQRLRIMFIAVGGLAALALLISAILSIDAVAELFKQRMSLKQEYDVGEMGRFGRHALGALLALDMPFGIGPLQFSKFFPEDPHNTFLNAFMAGGWISGVSFPALVLITLAFGLRAVFAPTPWQLTTIAVFSAYAGTMVESIIIDTDHWRHAFLLLGVLWGLIIATRRYRRTAAYRAAEIPAGAVLAPHHPAS